MHLTMYVETLRQQMNAAAETGGSEAMTVVERLSAGLEAATRLVLLEALSAAADEITRELAPGSVEVRLRGSDPEFVVTLPSYASEDVERGRVTTPPPVSMDGDEGALSRLNLRLPEGLKSRIEDAARREGLSLNAWLVRTAASAVDQAPMPRQSPGRQRYTGWVR
ncbi:MAG TPA: hypothetical protein VLA29_02290 [Acidimicrobiia bacterium]|nr:hypothetical protein [Acidimicrobiia bacterium]